MFQKVLIVEDLNSINVGVTNLVKKTRVPKFDSVLYCDDAYVKLKRAVLDGDPYELVISDLSFKQDYREQSIKSGEQLISKIKKELPETKTIVYSVEDRIELVRYLVKQIGIDAYVCKGRNGLKDLQTAIFQVAKNKTFVSPLVAQALKTTDDIEITEFDINLLEELSRGSSKEQISNKFKKKGISPSSISSLEKKLSILFLKLRAKNSVHLISIAKDIGLI